MVASLSLISLALSALSLVNARAVPRHDKPDGYVEGYLEKYSTYHERYLALQCYKKHGTPFFDLCCHPMLATENVKDNRDPSCDPANAESSSSSSTEAAATTTEVAQSTTTEVAESTPTGSTQPPAQFNHGDDEGDDLEDCDDEDDYDDDEDLEDCDEEETGGQGQGESQAPPTTQAPPPPTTTAEQAPTTTSTTEQAPTSTTEQAPTSTTEQTTEQAPTSTAEQAPTTTSTTEQAPPTSTTEEQAPPTTAATTTTSQESQPTQDSGNGNQGGNQGGDLNLGGFATFYYQNGNAGACGDRHGDDELIAAIDQERYGDLGQKSGLCGQRVSITNNNNGKSVTVVIADVCPTCDNGNSIDLSEGAFKAIAPLGDGHVPSESYIRF
ncbi:hypothetical protein PQX77_008564 [Marasmius sp. AFHP31]|nr:hypothetical protein PQX77_008564 [Marasmius sp. AFHP31]